MLISKLKNVWKSRSLEQVLCAPSALNALCSASGWGPQRSWKQVRWWSVESMIKGWLLLLLDYYSSYQWSWNIMKMKNSYCYCDGYDLMISRIFQSSDSRARADVRHDMQRSWPRSTALISSGSTSAKNQQVWSLPTDSIWGGEPKPAGRSAAALSICPMCYCAIVLYLCLQSEGHPLLVVWRWDVLTQLVLILAVLSMTKISKTEVAQNESYLTCLYLGCSSMCLLYQFLRAQAFPSLLPRCLRLCLV